MSSAGASATRPRESSAAALFAPDGDHPRRAGNRLDPRPAGEPHTVTELRPGVVGGNNTFTMSVERPPSNHRLSTVRVRARDGDYRVVQVQGNLFVCSKANGSCCCGWDEKGRMPFANDLWGDEWERRRIRNRLHLTFTGCLGPCIAGNNALLQILGRSIWLKDVNDPALVAAVFDYAEAMLAAGRVLPPPAALADHVYERYLPPPEGEWLPFVEADGDGGGLDRLDPVCLMDVDPATARHTVEYQGRVIAFCAPSCRKAFLADPEAYLIA
jgi:YHS domain-containing protein